jgi:hypothetical protein
MNARFVTISADGVATGQAIGTTKVQCFPKLAATVSVVDIKAFEIGDGVADVYFIKPVYLPTVSVVSHDFNYSCHVPEYAKVITIRNETGAYCVVSRTEQKCGHRVELSITVNSTAGSFNAKKDIGDYPFRFGIRTLVEVPRFQKNITLWPFRFTPREVMITTPKCLDYEFLENETLLIRVKEPFQQEQITVTHKETGCSTAVTIKTKAETVRAPPSRQRDSLINQGFWFRMCVVTLFACLGFVIYRMLLP